MRGGIAADLAELLFEEREIVRERLEELLGVQRREDHATVDLHVAPPRHDAPEVDDELARRMNDVREINILTLRDRVVEGDADGLLLLLIIHGGLVQPSWRRGEFLGGSRRAG